MSITIRKNLLALFIIGLFWPKAMAISELDSLYQVVNTAQEDTFKVKTLIDICWKLHRTDIAKTGEFANKSLLLSQKLDYQRGIGESYSYLSWVHFSDGNYEEALRYSYKAVAIGEKINDPILCTIAYNDIALIYKETGRPDDALAIWQKSVDLDIKSGRKKNIAGHYLNMADLMTENSNQEEAKIYYLKSLEATKDTKVSMIISAVHLGVGEMYFNENNLREARVNFSKALELAKKDDDLETTANAILGLSGINVRSGKKELALREADRAIKLAKKIGDVYSNLTALSKLAVIQRDAKEYKMSLNTSFEVIQLAEKNNMTIDCIDAYKEISKTYSEIDNYQQAFYFSEKYHAARDSFFSEQKAKNILNLEKKYQSDLKEKENKLLKLQRKEQELQINQNNTFNKALLFILLLLGVVGFMAYRQYKNKIQAHNLLEKKVDERTEELRLMNKNLETSNQELERFAHIASHDLREPLRNISGFAGLLKKELKPQAGSNIEEYLSFITNNTNQLSTLIQDILTYSKLNDKREQLIAVNPTDIINDINNTLAHSIKEKKVKVFVKSNLPLLKSSGRQVHFLFKNLIENGIKYNNSDFPRIDIVCNDIGNKYEFLVKDNGIGIDPQYSAKIFEMFTRLHDRGQFTGTGLGLSLCRKIVENHGGTIKVSSEKNKGSSFIFTWDKEFVEEVLETNQAINEPLTTVV